MASPATQILEIRTYRLYPGTRERFHQILTSGPIQALARHGITVVDFGPPIVDEGSYEEYYLMRAFASLDEREKLEEAFYGSEEWRGTWRDRVLANVESYHTIMVEVTPEVVTGLTRSRPAG